MLVVSDTESPPVAAVARVSQSEVEVIVLSGSSLEPTANATVPLRRICHSSISYPYFESTTDTLVARSRCNWGEAGC